MKNTTFRKKALLSSVAMLLVALVALGSATFAWFAANPNASATGLSMKTTASTGLLIKSDTDPVWDHSAILNAVESEDAQGNKSYSPSTTPLNLQPASQEQNNPGALWTIGASAADAFTAASGNMESAVNKQDFYAENIYFRLSDGSAATTDNVYLTGITMTAIQNAALQNSVKVAVAKGNQILVNFALTTANNNGTLTGTTPTAGTFNPAPVTKIDEPIEVFKGSDLSNKANDQDFLTVYLYLDGQHGDCYSEKVTEVDAEKIISALDFNFVLQPAPAQG